MLKCNNKVFFHSKVVFPVIQMLLSMSISDPPLSIKITYFSVFAVICDFRAVCIIEHFITWMVFFHKRFHLIELFIPPCSLYGESQKPRIKAERQQGLRCIVQVWDDSDKSWRCKLLRSFFCRTNRDFVDITAFNKEISACRTEGHK